MALAIRQAEKVRQFARVCLWGTPKAGKTHTALTLATALAGDGGKVGVISSEYGSSKLLSREFPHDIIDLAEPDEYGKVLKNPFTPERYEAALKLFMEAGYQAIVIDSLSHSWAGEGGILQAVDKTNNSFSDGWKANSPVYDHMVNAILSAKCHIIVTLRAKDAYVMEEYTKRDGSKGTMPKNAGLAPVMRKGFGFEMQLTIRMDSMIAHVEASGIEKYIHKGEEIEKPTQELAFRLLEALDGAIPPEPLVTRERLNEIYARGKKAGLYITLTDFDDLCRTSLGLDVPISAKEMTEAQAKDVDDHIAMKELQAASDKASAQAS